MLKQLLFVGVGGGAGSMMRYLVSVFTAKYYSGHFPLATFLVNITGCLLIGILLGFAGTTTILTQQNRLLLITGFCGGYTTFSAFSAENIQLIQNNQWATAALYIFASVLCGLLFVWLGLMLVQLINK